MEIMIVMIIIGILATLGVGGFQSSQRKARDSRRKSDLQQVAKSLEAYYNDKGQYPIHSGTYTIMGCANESSCAWGDTFEDENDTIYMIELPSDPAVNQNYLYESDGTEFRIYARLENELDPEISSFTGITCGTYECNFGVSSSNIRL